VLLYGPSKENKIAAAALIGEHLKQGVYRIDLSAIVSKYIGETEKAWKKFFRRQLIRTGSYFLMKQMPCLAKEQQ